MTTTWIRQREAGPENTHATGIEHSQRTAAMVAALAYLIGVALVVYANFGLRDRMFVRGDMAETIRRIAIGEARFRFSLAFDIVYCASVVVLLSALYVVLAPVSRLLATMAALLRSLQAATALLIVLNLSNVVRLATDPSYQTLDSGTLQALVRLNWTATGSQYYIGLAFWGISATLFAWLWLKSRYIAALFAVFGIVSSAWCASCALAYIIDPGFSRVVNLWWFDVPMTLFDIALSVWLLLKGLPRATTQ